MVWPLVVAAIAAAAAKGIGSNQAANREAAGYADARWDMSQIGVEAQKASSYADPYQQYRPEAAAMLNDYVTGKRSIQTDPGYQFAQQEGQTAVSRAAAARGMNNSGNVMAALQQRGQDIASQQYGSIIDRLTNLAGATSQNAAAGGQLYGNMMTTSLIGQGETEIGIGNAGSKGAGGMWGAASGAISSIGGFFK